ncbi:damage-inducible protein DinB [Pedobacter hiemivivus]|uniref:Damage-inducible protein DinB n=1 Tax=Pedobacter hiemivivus TaxID=2530454 RepID=A0A4R0NFZ2_9SPHI|nr:DinB family protein [Pedobacter hiemivivus]TCC99325.1 damage-inducible protein DinB [Pedobacter hiemivivus]TKC63827.1 damage-inducible protein DinB [Pedobacter hiemivivus]
MTTTTTTETMPFVSTENFLNEWLGHRRLTRRVIEAFPEDKLFDYSIGGMRPFAEMMKEIIDIAGPGIRGIATDNWENASGFDQHSLNKEDRTKEGLLKLWDQSTEVIIAFWPEISEARFQEVVLAFGQYEGPVYSTILYFIDNEIHHRAQGTVYLRSLGIEPPAFWNRD